MEKKMINKTAGCFCGEHKFNVLLDEKPRVFNCHCIDCRKKNWRNYLNYSTERKLC